MTEAWVLRPGDRIIINGQPVTITAVHDHVIGGTSDGLWMKADGRPGVAIDWIGDARLPDGSPQVLGRSIRRCSAEVEAA